MPVDVRRFTHGDDQMTDQRTQQVGAIPVQEDSRTRLSERIALWVFVAYLAAAVPLLLFWLGDFHWFLADDWDVVANYRLGDVSKLFEDRAGHWVTLPVLLYRALWNLFGLDYGFYQLLLVATHLAAVALLRVIMRRAGVGPWIATLTASILVLFGAGEPNIIWAFLIAFTGAFALGLGQLVLADHDGPIDRRDWWGLAAGVAAIMCSGVALVTVIVVGIAVIARRGWRPALFHVAPPLLLYVAWVAIMRPARLPQPEIGVVDRAGKIVTWDWNGLRGTFEALGQHPIPAALLAIVLVTGLVLAWSPMSLDTFRRTGAVPAAMLVGSFAYVTLTGLSRWQLGLYQANTPRYVYFIAAFMLPALAVAADAIARRSRILAPIVVVLLLSGLPGNIGQFGHNPPWTPPYFAFERRLVQAIPFVPEASLVPADVRPEPAFASGITVGWLRDLAASGQLEEPTDIPQTLHDQIRMRIGLAQRPAVPLDGCPILTAPMITTLPQGTVLSISGAPLIAELLRNGQPTGAKLTLAPENGSEITVELPDLELRLSAGDPSTVIRYTGDTPDRELRLCGA
jgi:hypothetical protein